MVDIDPITGAPVVHTPNTVGPTPNTIGGTPPDGGTSVPVGSNPPTIAGKLPEGNFEKLHDASLENREHTTSATGSDFIVPNQAPPNDALQTEISDNNPPVLQPQDLKPSSTGLPDSPMKRGALTKDGKMTEFKTKLEPMIAGQHATEVVNLPEGFNKAEVLGEIQLVLRDGGMDTMSQIKSLERIATILHLNDK